MELINNLLDNFKKGEIIIVFDDENRENEADMIVAIDMLTPEKVNYMITHAKGLLCASISQKIAREKGFPLMPDLKQDKFTTAFTVSVDSKKVKPAFPHLKDILPQKI